MGVGIDDRGRCGGRAPNDLALAFDLRGDGGASLVEHGIDIDALALQHHLALHDAGNVDQFGDQVAQLIDLALDHLAHRSQLRAGALHPSQQGRDIGDRRQRAAHPMRQLGHEVFAALLRQAQLAAVFRHAVFERLALRDVQAGADVAQEHAVIAVARDPGIENPAINAVMTAQPVVEAERCVGTEAGFIDAQAALEVVGVHALGPARSHFLAQRATAKREPGIAEPFRLPLGAGHPDQDRRRLRARLGTALGLDLAARPLDPLAHVAEHGEVLHWRAHAGWRVGVHQGHVHRPGFAACGPDLNPARPTRRQRMRGIAGRANGNRSQLGK